MSETPPADSDMDGGASLRYQAGRTLFQCSAFRASLQVATTRFGNVFAGLRRDALELFDAGDRQFLYDLEGRILRLGSPNRYLFRGLSGLGAFATKRPRTEGGGFGRGRLSEEEVDAMAEAACQLARATVEATGDPARAPHPHTPEARHAREAILPVLTRAAANAPELLRRDAARFADVYRPVPILPPDQYAAFVVQATEGCSFNTCTFCDLYRGIPFRVRSPAEFEAHLEQALAFHGAGLWRRTSVFLDQANALAVPQAQLVQLFAILRQHIELPPPEVDLPSPSWVRARPLRFAGVASFVDGFIGQMKRVSDYRQLRELGLRRVYLGVESGSEELLRWLRKPADPQQMRETIRRIQAAGVHTDVILLVGAGGERFATQHVASSIEFLRAAALRPGDRVYLSELVNHPHLPYAARCLSEGVRPLDATELAAQARSLAAAIRGLGQQPVAYRIEPFVY